MNPSNSILQDQFGGNHNYLRISLTERCNLRCFYCMPLEGVPLRDKKEFMSTEEMVYIAKIFVEQGVNKIRLTGGEPLIKKDISNILKQLGMLPIELTLTTNAIIADRFIGDFKAAGIKSLNVSLDSLNASVIDEISRRQFGAKILANTFKLIREGFKVKLNVVLIKGTNDHEILDFIELTRNLNVEIRFIEFMPFFGNRWSTEKKVSEKEILDLAGQKYGSRLSTLAATPNQTARNFSIEGFRGSFGIISTVTNPFCDSCNRLRLTADGKIKNCLFSADENDLLSALRKGKDIIPLIAQNVNRKKARRAGIDQFESDQGEKIYSQNRSMITIGG